MVQAQVTETIRCKPDELLEFVMDIERYAEVDVKIRPIDWARRDGELTEFRFRPKLPGVPLPSPKWVQQIRLTPGRRVDITNAPLPHNRLGHRMLTFTASFVVEPVDAGTKVTRTVRMDFKPYLRWLAEPMLRGKLQAGVQDEIRGAKAYLEGRHDG
ncbi:MAG: SRPBCC family protein [Thermocrispum sp.]